MNTRFLALALLAPGAQAQLMIPDSTNDRIMLFDPGDGSLIDDNFIDLTVAVPAPATPIEAILVEGEIWVSDQFSDIVYRFDTGGAFLGTVTMGRDNIRGIAYANGSLYVTNSGSQGAGYGDVVKEYDLAGTLLNQIPVGDPFDVLDTGTGLLIADISGNDLISVNYDGTGLTTFHDSDGTTGIDFPEQMAIKGSNGNILAAGFLTPSGLYEYDRTTGAQVNFIDTGESGLRGVAELGNGNLIFTNGTGVFVYDVGAGTTTQVIGGVGARFITDLGGDTAFGENYCVSAGNSVSANGSRISGSGSISLADMNVTLEANNAPNQPAIFFFGPNQVLLPFGNGFRCVGGTTTRMPVVVGSGGFFSYSIDFGTFGATLAGLGTVNFQCWYRDPAAGGAAFNLSDALEVIFTP